MDDTLIAFLSGNAFEVDNVANYHNDHIRAVGGSGLVMYTCVAPTQQPSKRVRKFDSVKGFKRRKPTASRERERERKREREFQGLGQYGTLQDNSESYLIVRDRFMLVKWWRWGEGAMISPITHM